MDVAVAGAQGQVALAAVETNTTIGRTFNVVGGRTPVDEAVADL